MNAKYPLTKQKQLEQAIAALWKQLIEIFPDSPEIEVREFIHAKSFSQPVATCRILGTEKLC